jgi:NAD(P)-dependent dehydrogenase (short-subunit alcohol dehydrogenase family)
MDLADPASIDAFAKTFRDSKRPLHLLINNAGIMAAPLARDARGYESQFATNHLGHFQLTLRLWPTLASGARIVSLSSRGHHRSAIDFEDTMYERRPYEKWAAYGQAKTANVLFAVGLEARGATRGIHAFAVHPGGIVTDLMARAACTARIATSRRSQRKRARAACGLTRSILRSQTSSGRAARRGRA